MTLAGLEHARPRQAVARRPGLLLAGVLLLLAGLLCALGVWQVQRRVWKLDLIARVEARIHAAPVAPLGPTAWTAVTAPGYEYLHVRATGHFLLGETLVQAVTEKSGGYWVLAPFQTSDGFVVLINRGFVPPDLRSRPPGPAPGETVVTGLLRISEPGGAFLRANDPTADRWFSRDVAAIADAEHLGSVAPYFIDADGTPNPSGYPVGGLTMVRFANSHLVYALTWFALAGMAVAGAVISLRRR